MNNCMETADVNEKKQSGISIIIPTLGRKKELYDLLESIRLTVDRLCYEIIIVDQNRDGLLNDLLQTAGNLPIQHCLVPFSGLAQARNFGIKKAAMPYLFFADDDMRFLPGALQRSWDFLENNKEFWAVSGCMIDENNSRAVSCFASGAHKLDLKRHFRGYFIESSILFRKKLFDEYEFDESLGCGRFHGAEEGADLLFRVLSDGKSIYYDPEVKYHHPSKISDYISQEEIRRVFFYRAGFSKFCMKNRQYKTWWKRVVAVSGYLVLLTLFFSPKKRYYFSELLGLLSGIVIR